MNVFFRGACSPTKSVIKRGESDQIPQALSSNVLSSIQALGTLSSSTLLSPLYHTSQRCCSHMSSLSGSDIYGFVRIPTASVPRGRHSRDPPALDSGGFQLCCSPLKGPNIPTINKLH